MTSKPLTLRNWLALFTSFVILTVAFAFGLFCWPALYRPLTKAWGWNFASANAGGSIVLFLIGVCSPFVGTLGRQIQAEAGDPRRHRSSSR